MNKKKQNKLSVFMTKILRHNPELFNITLDEQGFCDIGSLIDSITKENFFRETTIEDVVEVVRDCSKQRFEINSNDNKIRARYGHSCKKINYKEQTPPSLLYHGTGKTYISQIMKEGLKSMSRQYVHLSETTDFASLAGRRKGDLQLLKIDTVRARQMKVSFFYVGNEVWLSSDIPSCCISK